MEFSTLILAAGAGTRMKSIHPKVAHELLGKPLVRWVIDAAREAGSTRILTVIGHGSGEVLPLVDGTTVVVQEERLGTGHAVMMAREVLEAGSEAAGDGTRASLVVLCGDTPLLTAATIAGLVEQRHSSSAAACVLTCQLKDPTSYGRIVRDRYGMVLRIIEEKDATPEERRIHEVNSGAYCFDVRVLLRNLEKLQNHNAQGEFYLTDMLALIREEGGVVVAHPGSDARELLGINSRGQLAQATRIMQQRINDHHMAEGVTILDPSSAWIGPDVTLGTDVEILPQTILYGNTQVGSGSVLGPGTRIIDSVVGADCVVDESVVLDARLEDGVRCGPRAYLRAGTVMQEGSKAGTHVEIKNSVVGPGSKVPHLSYLGDATLGAGVNVGAGSITCNYDGASKNPTIIGDGAFIGSDTMFVAPVHVGAHAVTGAGSVITKDVPEGALALERTSQRVIDGWAERHSKDEDGEKCADEAEASAVAEEVPAEEERPLAEEPPATEEPVAEQMTAEEVPLPAELPAEEPSTEEEAAAEEQLTTEEPPATEEPLATEEPPPPATEEPAATERPAPKAPPRKTGRKGHTGKHARR